MTVKLKIWDTWSHVCVQQMAVRVLCGWVVVSCAYDSKGRHLKSGEAAIPLFEGELPVIKAVVDSEIELFETGT